MTETITTAVAKPNNFFKAFFFTGLLAGTLDATAAMTQFMFRTNWNDDPLKVWRYVASGFFGQNIMTKDIWSAAGLGLLFHFCIAFSFTLFFYLIYPKLKFLSKNLFITGMLYGIFVWLVMNLVVVPFSNVTSKAKLWTTDSGFQFPPNPTQMIIGILIIMFCVGLPIALLAGRYYSRRR